MVAACGRARRRARLFPDRGQGRRPLLAVPQRRWRGFRYRRSQLASARGLRVTAPATTYVELQVSSHFSFLRGVSSAKELFRAAEILGYPALGLTDRNTVGGLVKGLRESDEWGVRLIAGCRL